MMARPLRQECRSVACPTSLPGEIHNCDFFSDTGLWRCSRCGLSGNALGFSRLMALEAERQEHEDLKVGEGSPTARGAA